MRESDFIAPLGIAAILAGLKGVQNRENAAYAEEVERLNELALQSQEETEDVSPDENEKLTFSDNLSEMGSDAFNSLIGAAFTPGGLIGKGLAFTMGMNAATGFGNETIQDMVEVLDPEDIAKTVPPKKEGEFSLFGLTDLYRDMAGDDGKLNFMPNVLAPGGQSPYLGYKDGGRIHLKGGGMDASKSDFGKSKNNDNTKNKDDKDDTKNKPDTGPGSLTTPSPSFGPLGITPTPGELDPLGPTGMAPLGFMSAAMDDEDSTSPSFGPSALGNFGFNIGDVSVNVNPFGSTQLGMTAPLGSIPGIRDLFGYKDGGVAGLFGLK